MFSSPWPPERIPVVFFCSWNVLCYRIKNMSFLLSPMDFPMPKNLRKTLMLCTLVTLFVMPAMAQEKAESVVKVQAKEKGATGPLKDWLDAENALIDPLSDKDKESFFILRNKYSIIRTIGVVERDIGNAVKACSKENPDMKDKMNQRFSEWKSSVNPIIDAAKKQLDKDLEAQKIVDVKEAKKVFKLNDAAFEYSEKQITKKPVSSKEACEGLLASMNDTENNMIGLLQETLLPESAIRTKDALLKKEEAAAKSAKPKAESKTEPKKE